MDLSDWMAEYKRICRELDILPKDDYDARDLAARLMKGREQPLDRLSALIKGRLVAVFGAGPSLEEDLEGLDREGKTLLAADGAASCLLENGIYPDAVVTDLDGDLKDLLMADSLGAIMVVHAHGGNVDRVRTVLPRLKNAVATTQTEPLPEVRNFFGFTDGDRAVFLAKHFGARGIELAGFDFGDEAGRYSDPANPKRHKASDRKRKKLKIAERLVKRALQKS